MNERKEYIFWVNSFRYRGEIISETPTHWTIRDIKLGKIDIPKTAVRQEVVK